MPSACTCPTPVYVNVPGSPGAPGADGTTGTKAYTLTNGDFIVPAKTGSVTIAVLDNTWIALGLNLFIQGAGYFEVNSKAGTTILGITYLDYGINTAAGATIASGSQVSPAGTQPDFPTPLTIALGGTEATTKAGAQAALGLGQNATSVSISGLGQVVTNASVAIAGVVVTAPAAGVYLVLAFATYDLYDVQWMNVETISLTVRNVTQSTTLNTATKSTDYLSYQYGNQYGRGPAQDYVLPYRTVTLAAGDVVELQTQLSTAPAFGSLRVSNGSLCLVPLSLT